MPVTEFALLHLSSSKTPSPEPKPLPDDLIPLLTDATTLQSAWHARHFPHLPSSADASARASAWFRQVEDPSWIMTTARWESVDAHWEWIKGDENQKVMAELVGEGKGEEEDEEEGKEGKGGDGDGKGDGNEGGAKGERGYIVAGDTVLFHVEGSLFSEQDASRGEGYVPLLESPVVGVERMFVLREKKGEFAEAFERLKGMLQDVSPLVVRSGWRADGEAEAEEDEFVVVCGWESVEKHMEIAGKLAESNYCGILELVSRIDVKNYKRLL